MRFRGTKTIGGIGGAMLHRSLLTTNASDLSDREELKLVIDELVDQIYAHRAPEDRKIEFDLSKTLTDSTLRKITKNFATKEAREEFIQKTLDRDVLVHGSELMKEELDRLVRIDPSLRDVVDRFWELSAAVKAKATKPKVIDPALDEAKEIFLKSLRQIGLHDTKDDDAIKQHFINVLESPLLDESEEKNVSTVRLMLEDEDEAIKLIPVLQAVGRLDERRRKAVDEILKHLSDAAAEKVSETLHRQKLEKVMETRARSKESQAKLDEARKEFLEALRALGGEPNQAFAEALETIGIKPSGGAGIDWNDLLENHPRKIAEAARSIQGRFPSFADLAKVMDGIADRSERKIREAVSSIESTSSSATNDPRPPTATLADNPRAAMMQYGAWILKMAERDEDYKHLPDRQEIVRMLARGLADKIVEATIAQIVARENSFHPREDERRTFLNTAECVVAGGIRWARAGFPTVVPTHRLAASMMAMSIAPDAVRDVRLPWPCFCIVLPDGLLPEDGPVPGAHALWVTYSDEDPRAGEEGEAKKYAAIAYARREKVHEAVILFEFSTAADLAAISAQDEQEKALVELVSMLVLGVSIELDQKEHKDAIDRGPPGASSKKTEKKEKKRDDGPRSWTFELRRDVKVDMRPWVRSYVAGGGKSPSVQILVRGHHKRQVCGKGRLDRKWIYVEAYWKGPEDAPIAVRQHTFKEEK